MIDEKDKDENAEIVVYHVEDAETIVLEEKETEEFPVVFLMDRFGYMKLIDLTALERNREAAMSEYRYVINCMNTDKICIFTDTGRMHTVKASDIPLVRFRDKGTPADNVSNYDSRIEQILYVAPLSHVEKCHLLFITKNALCKLVPGDQFVSSKRTIASTKLSEEDALILVEPAENVEQAVLESTGGYLLRFPLTEIPEMKRASAGVRGMKLKEDDTVSHAYLLDGKTDRTIEYKGHDFSLMKVKLSKTRGGSGVKPRLS